MTASMCWSCRPTSSNWIASLACDVAVLINIAPDHLERHGGMEGYVAAKRRIFEGQPRGATAIVGLDDDESRQVYEDAVDVQRGNRRSRHRNFIAAAVPGGVYAHRRRSARRHGWQGRRGDARCRDIETLPGTHNAPERSGRGGFAAARHICLKSRTIVDGIRSFPGLPHRLQLIDKIDGIRYINDSKATNAEAAARALASYDNIYWIAGGRAKEGGLTALDPYLSHVRRAFLIGESADHMAAELRGRVDTRKSGDLKTAIQDAQDAALRDGIAGAVVLLSPACASFDQFKDFELRGIEFQRLVAEMPRGSLRNVKRGETA